MIAQAPRLKAVDMFNAQAEGRITTIWIIHTNPAVSMPNADRVAAAIRGCAFSVVSGISAATDTARLAHVVLPASAWGENDGTVTNSERCISRQRAFPPPLAGSRPDWAILAEVERRRDGRRPSTMPILPIPFAHTRRFRALRAGWGATLTSRRWAGISRADHAGLAPCHWPRNATPQGGRFFADGGAIPPTAAQRCCRYATVCRQHRSAPRSPLR